MIRLSAALAALMLFPGSGSAQELPSPDPCEALLGRGPQSAWPGIVLDAVTGDTLLVQIKHIGARRVKLAGIRAPRGQEPLAAVARFHLATQAKGLRVFVVLDPPWKVWPAEVTAIVEAFALDQISAGLARTVPGEEALAGPYGSCRAGHLESEARRARIGIWGISPP